MCLSGNKKNAYTFYKIGPDWDQSLNEIQIRALLFNKALTICLTEYSYYSNVFSAKYIVKLSKYIKINNHVIKLKKG